MSRFWRKIIGIALQVVGVLIAMASSVGFLLCSAIAIASQFGDGWLNVLVAVAVITLIVGVTMISWGFHLFGWKRTSACPQCEYDLRGQREHGCPECGWNRSA